jgi:hypothetical protein
VLLSPHLRPLAYTQGFHPGRTKWDRVCMRQASTLLLTTQRHVDLPHSPPCNTHHIVYRPAAQRPEVFNQVCRFVWQPARARCQIAMLPNTSEAV